LKRVMCIIMLLSLAACIGTQPIDLNATVRAAMTATQSALPGNSSEEQPAAPPTAISAATTTTLPGIVPGERLTLTATEGILTSGTQPAPPASNETYRVPLDFDTVGFSPLSLVFDGAHIWVADTQAGALIRLP
jgi:hypothetical protein